MQISGAALKSSVLPFMRPRTASRAANCCPRCNTQMQLTSLALVKPAQDLQALDCPSCHHTELLIG